MTGVGRPAAFVAAVLTGGASRRMGRHKATLLLGGVPMARRVGDAALAAGAEEVVAVGRPVDGLAHVDDDHPGEGPLGGVLTALRRAGERPVVVLGCDLVQPSAAAIAAVATHLAGSPAHDVAVPVADGREQWLHACWRPTAGPGAEAAFAEGERSLHRTAARLRVLRYHDPDSAPYADADLADDLPGHAR